MNKVLTIIIIIKIVEIFYIIHTLAFFKAPSSVALGTLSFLAASKILANLLFPLGSGPFSVIIKN